MTFESHNACAMYHKNDTAAFIRKTLNFADCKYLQQKAREIDGSGQAKKRQEAQALAYKETVQRKQKAETERKAAQDAKRAKIDTVMARLDVEDIKRSPRTNTDLDLQLDWHRRCDDKVPIKSNVTKKADKIKALIEAVECHNEGQQVIASYGDDNNIQIDVLSDLDEEGSDFE